MNYSFVDEDLDLLDFDSKKSLGNFIRNSRSRKVTIVCGAGVSVSAGLPSWSDYLKKIVSIFLYTWKDLEETNPKYLKTVPRGMSISMLDEHYRVKYPNFIIPPDFLKEDPLFIAQLIKNCIAPLNWKYLLKKALYRDGAPLNFESSLLDCICNMTINHSQISGIMTYNYDDLLEIAFKNKNFSTSSIIEENYFKYHKTFPIYHLHGILTSQVGRMPESKIYLSEEDFLTDIVQPNSWYNQIHASKLTGTCCLFIGLSFNDPSLKRKLAIHRLNPGDFHYALLTHGDTEFEKRKFLLLRNELLRLNVRVIKYSYDKSHSRLIELIQKMDKYMD